MHKCYVGEGHDSQCTGLSPVPLSCGVDGAAAVTDHPDPLALHCGVEFSAVAMLLHESVEGGQQLRHGRALPLRAE